MKRVLHLAIEAGETTCASRPYETLSQPLGRCRFFIPVSEGWGCAIFSRYGHAHEIRDGRAQRLPECIAAERGEEKVKPVAPTNAELAAVRLADVLPQVTLTSYQRWQLERRPSVTLLDARRVRGIGPATIAKLYAARPKPEGGGA